MKLKTLAAAAALVAASAAHADLTSTLTFADASAGLGAGPYATVVVSQGINDHTVSITETMLNGYKLVNTGGPHHTFAFNVLGTESLSFAGPAGYSFAPSIANPGPVVNQPWGTFEYGVVCDVCGNGASHPQSGPLTFTLTSNNLLDPSLFVGNADGYLFSSDVVSTTDNQTFGKTGNVASIAAVPEPETYALMLAGLGVVGFIAKRRRS